MKSISPRHQAAVHGLLAGARAFTLISIVALVSVMVHLLLTLCSSCRTRRYPLPPYSRSSLCCNYIPLVLALPAMIIYQMMVVENEEECLAYCRNISRPSLDSPARAFSQLQCRADLAPHEHFASDAHTQTPPCSAARQQVEGVDMMKLLERFVKRRRTASIRVGWMVRGDFLSTGSFCPRRS